MKARKNFAPSIGPGVDLKPDQIKKGFQAYEDWHWGIPAAKVVDWDDDDFPEMLIECGRLIRVHVRAPMATETEPHPRRKRDTRIEFSRRVSANSHIAYDPDHPDDRLYILMDQSVRPTVARELYQKNNLQAMPLNYLASLAGGRHSKRQDYPDVMVKPVGVLTAVVYFTHKKGDENPGDDRSYYIHKMGELSHHYPFLACDAQGRLWIAGGNYTSPTPGITD